MAGATGPNRCLRSLPRDEPGRVAVKIAVIAAKAPQSGSDSSNFNYRFDLNRHVGGNGTHPDGATCVPTSIAEHFHEQIRAAVDHLCMVGKIRYTFGWPEVAEILIKKQDIHEGERMAAIEFSVTGGVFGQGQADAKPGVMVNANGVQLIKHHLTAPPHLVVDAKSII